jgi:SAM-dependent methyltransferase
MVYATPMPADEILTDYNANYFESAHNGLTTNRVSVNFFSAVAWIRIQHIEKYVKDFNITVKRVLEIGPGIGYFAKNWLSVNPDNQYNAVETDPSCYKSLSKAGVGLLTRSQMAEKNEFFDMAVLSHVLEHVSRPKDFLITILASVRKGGIVFIEVPCLDWQHKSQDEPHLLFFEKKSMNTLLTSVGFSNIQLSYHGKTIESVKKKSVSQFVWSKIRLKLLQAGLKKHFLFSIPATGNT